MSKGTLFIKPASPRSNWLDALAKTLKVDVDVVDCSKSEEYAKLFPLKKTPAFADSEGYELTEVLAIIEYLFSLASDKTLRGVTNKDQAQVMRWLSFVNQDMVNTWVDYVFVAKTEEAKKAASEQQAEQLAYINSELATRSWLAVDGYVTVADEYFFSWYAGFADVAGGISSAKYPYLTKWHENMKAKDVVAKSLSKL
ncbi:hypothetical protein PMKS-000136 [Pichia membranifaciens]|uniref:GST C-terminal domain-containing protein n=1 Tax=Pichia membranifaciens TaxID=4926 RepID=A0A1Q2YAX4_9ASCO|nr:hypothetical protein PMKS-000136 [Pichia membranifaciens]